VTKTDTRTAILEGVLHLLDTRERATYEAVAQHAGVSRQTVYTHFPTRAELLVAAVDRARETTGIAAATGAVLEAPTARAALEAFVDLHCSIVPRILPAYVAVERERSLDPDIEAAFVRRSASRRQLALLVATRLHAEKDLVAPWTVTTACDLISTLTSGTTTAQLLRDVDWTVADLRERLLVILQRSLLEPIEGEE
jgi:AcrR family transcriptional regulator